MLLDRFTSLSPSALRLFRNAPVAWCARYLYELREDAGCKAWRGRAIEHALDQFLFLKTQDPAMLTAAARSSFDEQAMGEISDEITAERDSLEGYITQAITLAAKYPVPFARQARIERTYANVDLPVVGYADWIFEDGGALDLKTTTALPAKPRADDVVQVAFYGRKKASLLYVTPKKAALYHIAPDDIAAANEDIAQAARTLCAALKAFSKPRDMLAVYPLMQDSYLVTDAVRQTVKDALNGR